MNSPASTMDRIVARPAWRRKPVLLAAAAAVAVAALTTFIVEMPASGTVTVASDSIDFAVAKRAAFQDYLALRGEVVPMSTTFVTAAVAGSVQSVSAADGEKVEAGHKLATLTNSEFSLGLTGQEAEVSVRISEANRLLLDLNKAKTDSDAQLADVAYALHKAELELEKRQDLLDHGVVNEAYIKSYRDEVFYQRERLRDMKAAHDSEAPRIADQQRQIEASAEELKRNLRDIRQGRDALIITAPAAGRLTAYTLKPGQAIKAGDSLGEIDSENDFKIKALVDEYYVSRVATGLKGTALIDGKSWPLTLTKVYQQVAGGRVTVEMEFAGERPANLRPGATMDVKLSLGDTQEALVVPNGPWLRENGGTAIFVVGSNAEQADVHPVTIGRRNPDSVEILGGLSAGERVVTATRLEKNDARHLLIKKGKQQ